MMRMAERFLRNSMMVALALSALPVLAGCSSGNGRTEAVRAFLNAIASGSAVQALAHACVPISGPFLTDQAVAASQVLAPLTVESVKNGAGASSVDAVYDIGGNRVSHTFSLQSSNGKWCILTPDLTSSVRLHLTGSLLALSAGNQNKFTVTMAGEPVQSNDLALLPGLYRLAVPNSLVSWAGPQILVAEPGQSQTVDLPDPTLAPGADVTISAAVNDKLAGCLAEKAVVTSCGFGAAKTFHTHPGDAATIKWASNQPKLTGDVWQLDQGATAVSLAGGMSFTMTYSDTRGTYVVGVKSNVVVQIDNPAGIVVQFPCSDDVQGCDSLVSFQAR